MDLRHVSEPSWTKLHQLGASSAFACAKAQRVELVEQLAQSHEPSLLPHLANFAIDDTEPARDAARSALSRLLTLVPIERLFELDWTVRQVACTGLNWDRRWMGLSPDVLRNSTVSEMGIGLPAITSMHNHGRVREAAVDALSLCTTGDELPYLLLRLNDWVAPIRDRAVRAVRKRLRLEYAARFIDCLPLVQRLEACARTTHGWLLEAIGLLLRQPETEPLLAAAFLSPNFTIRRVCLRLGVSAGSPCLNAALRAAVADPEPLTRLWAAKQLLKVCEIEALPALRLQLADDHFMPIRRAALQSLVERQSPVAHAALLEALLDRHASIRNLARFELRRSETFDASTFYRQVLPSITGDRLASALRGLGECSIPTDAEAILPFLQSKETRVRRAAVAAIGRLAPKERLPQLLAAIADESPSVSFEASRALTPFADAVEQEQLRHWLANPQTHVRKSAFLLVLHLGSKWERLPWLLAISRGPSERLAKSARATVQEWLARHCRYYADYTTPSPSQLADTRRELELSADALGKTATTLASMLAGFGET